MSRKDTSCDDLVEKELKEELTRCKEKLEILQNTELDLRALLESVPIACQTLDENGKIKWVNGAWEKLFGYSKSDVIGKVFGDLLEDSSKNIFYENIKKLLSSSGQTCEHNMKIVRKDGERRVVSINGKLLTNIHVDFGQFFCVVCDLTDQVRARDEMETSRNRFKFITDQLPVVIWTVDKNLTFTMSEGSGLEQMGLIPGEVVGTGLYEYFQTKDPGYLPISKHLRSLQGESCAFDLAFQDRTYSSYLEPFKDIDDNIIGVIGISFNTTAQKQIENELRESEERFRSLMSYIPGVSIQGYTVDGTVLYWNQASEAVYGFTADEAIGKNLADLIIPVQEKHLFRKALELGAATTQSGEFMPSGELELLHKDGSLVPVYSIHTVVCLEGKDNLMFCIDMDLSERKQMEEELRKSEERFRTIFENAPVGLYRTTPDGRVLMTNPKMAEMLGFDTVEELLKRDINKEGYAPGYKRSDFIKSIEANDFLESFESTFLKKDGTPIEIEETAKVIRDSKGEVLYYEGLVLDITERKQLEKERIKASKLESIGLLAGGIAHDFNNFLGAALINLWSARQSRLIDGEIKGQLENAEKTLVRAKDLTLQLLTFSKGGTPSKKKMSIENVIKDSIELVLSGSNVTSNFNVKKGVKPVEIDASQMNQVFNNLLINAEQAMPQGGVVDITLDNFRIKKTGRFLLPEGDYVRVIIRDEGHGISNESADKIFDPYFTTKQKGSGLGLTTSYSIVKKHGGVIRLKSDKGIGSTFEVYLPACLEESVDGNFKDNRNLDFDSKTIKILVMDDEELYRKGLKLALESLGHEVCAAGDGKEAIDLYTQERERGQEFELLIMDLTIPGGMGGKEAMDVLTERYPDVKAIISSGYSEDPVISEYKEHGFLGVVAKPYTIEDLIDVISRVIK
ncbi:PAS domain S-box protein [Gemmatimonadota bacterium]